MFYRYNCLLKSILKKEIFSGCRLREIFGRRNVLQTGEILFFPPF